MPAGFEKTIKKFHDFLLKGGANIIETTNPYEVARFITSNGVCVVYHGKRGVSFSNEYAQEAWAAFSDNRKWMAGEKKKRIHRKTVEEIIIGRDGLTCFYCGDEMGDKPTLEHLLSISDGGSNHLSNLCLCCEACNKEAANLPIVKKIHLRETMRRMKDN